MENDEDRGRPATFDPASGAVRGSGAGAGGGAGSEDYDRDDKAGAGHPLPDSDEARHNEIPESLERAKGRGDDAAARTVSDAVTPDGEHYPAEDLGRGPATEDGGRNG